MDIMNTMMLSCINATELMERKEFMPLSFMQKIQLRAHIAMCSGCRNYMKQTALINHLLHRSFDSVPVVDSSELERSIISKFS